MMKQTPKALTPDLLKERLWSFWQWTIS